MVYTKKYLTQTLEALKRHDISKDAQDIDKMLKESDDYCHILVVGLCKIMGDKLGIKAIACLSFVPQQNVGCFISWLAVTPDLFTKDGFVGAKGDDQPFRGRGLASLLVSVCLAYKKTHFGGGSLLIQVNPNEKEAIAFWMSRLLFTPLKAKQQILTKQFLDKKCIIKDDVLEILAASYDCISNIWPAEVLETHSVSHLFNSTRITFFGDISLTKEYEVSNYYPEEIRDILLKPKYTITKPAVPKKARDYCVLDESGEMVHAYGAILEHIYSDGNKKSRLL